MDELGTAVRCIEVCTQENEHVGWEASQCMGVGPVAYTPDNTQLLSPETK